MARKTRKHTKKYKSDVMTIPEVRRSFEHIENYIHECHMSGEARPEIIKHLRKEWFRTFNKELSKGAAESLLSAHISTHSSSKTRRHSRIRGGYNLGGAPIDLQLRQGNYDYMSQGGMGDYFTKGLAVGIPTSGMTNGAWPSVPQGLGDNSVSTQMKGGSRRGVRRRGGANIGALLSAAFERPVGGTSPPSVLFDAQSAIKGQLIQSASIPYQASPNTKPITF